MPVMGKYNYEDKDYVCNQNNCVTLYDIARGHFTYNTNWFWSMLVTHVNK